MYVHKNNELLLIQRAAKLESITCLQKHYSLTVYININLNENQKYMTRHQD